MIRLVNVDLVVSSINTQMVQKNLIHTVIECDMYDGEQRDYVEYFGLKRGLIIFQLK